MAPTDTPLPIADAGWIDGAARRTRLLRLALGVGLVALLGAAFVTAPRHPGRRYLPANAVGVVVLDVSSSVRPATYYRIEQTLDAIAASKGRLGLVLFSDTAYEAFPTGTPAVDLKALLRFFAPPAQTAGGGQTYLANSPWQQWFSAGTRISQGLYLAQHMLEVEHANRGAVLLISDLADDPHDVDGVRDAVVSLEQKSVPIEKVKVRRFVARGRNVALLHTAVGSCCHDGLPVAGSITMCESGVCSVSGPSTAQYTPV